MKLNHDNNVIMYIFTHIHTHTSKQSISAPNVHRRILNWKGGEKRESFRVGWRRGGCGSRWMVSLTTELGIWDSKVVCYVYIKLTRERIHHRKSVARFCVSGDNERSKQRQTSFQFENLCVSFCGRNI